ncbi:MAG: hypothetical protein AAGE52_00400 [Myxococcota bacterium]
MRSLVIVIALLVGCGDDSAPVGDAGTDVALDAAPATNPAFLVVNRVRTPDSRAIFLNVLPDLEPRTIEPGNGLEVGGSSRATVYDGKVYAFESETGEVARYRVTEGLELVEDGRFSMTGLGITRFRTQFIFLSPTRAYYVDIAGRQVVVFNPTAMEIVSTFPAVEFERGDFNISVARPVQVGDRVMIAVAWDNASDGEFVPSVAVVVLSATEDRVERIIEDDRCALAGGGFADGDRFYAIGDSGAGGFDIFGVAPIADPCVVRTDGETFDDFVVDLRTVTGAPHFSDAIGAGDGTFVTRIYDSDIDPDTLTDPFGFFNLEVWRYAIVEIETGTTSRIEDLPLSGISFDPIVIEGDYYVQLVDEDEGRSTLYRLSTGGATETVEAIGDIQGAARIR